MHDQNFSTPPQRILLPDENHPQNEFTQNKKVTLNEFLLKKYTLHTFFIYLFFFIFFNAHPNQVAYVLNKIIINFSSQIDKKIQGEKWYPFPVKDKFQKYPFLSKLLFLTPLTCHEHYACYALSCKNSHVFLVTHVYTVEESPRGYSFVLVTLKYVVCICPQ